MADKAKCGASVPSMRKPKMMGGGMAYKKTKPKMNYGGMAHQKKKP